MSNDITITYGREATYLRCLALGLRLLLIVDNIAEPLPDSLIEIRARAALASQSCCQPMRLAIVEEGTLARSFVQNDIVTPSLGQGIP